MNLSIANEHGSLPLAHRLYLPKVGRRRGATEESRVPAQVEFRTKTAIALEQIDQALAAGVPQGADAAYGTETHRREQLCDRGLLYMVGVRANMTKWWADHQPAPMPPARFPADGPERGRPRRHPRTDLGS